MIPFLNSGDTATCSRCKDWVQAGGRGDAAGGGMRGASYESGIGWLSKHHASTAQNGGHPTRGDDISRSAIRAMIPPELSLEVCIAAERDLEAGRTWRDGQHLPPEALVGSLFGLREEPEESDASSP